MTDLNAAEEAPPAPPGPPAAASTTDFPLTWADPSDVERTWRHDDMHAPFCLAPLAWDYGELISGGFAYRYERLELPIDMRAQVFNGYLYFSWKALVAESEEDALDAQYIQACRDHTRYASEYWERAVPQLRELYSWIVGVAVDELPAGQLADAWEGAWERAQRAWCIHFYAITGPYQVMDDLADLYESVVENAPPGEAMRLIQGSIDELVDVDSGMGRLTSMAAASPELAAAIGGSVTPSIDELAGLPGSREFVSELDGFLQVHGHLGQGWDDLGLASWAEQPAMIVAEIAKRLEHPVEPATDRAARLAGEADDLADTFRKRLAEQPEKLAEFERLLVLARQIGRITETHNYWIDRMAQARLRTFAMRVGARLARDGVIERPEDILYFRRSEVPGVLRSQEDRRPLVAERKADHTRWRSVTPPAMVGKPSSAETSGRFSGVRFDKEDEAIVRGTGASAGIVSGPARIVLGPDDFGRVRPGDIIVAPSSNPSWVPLFTIAGGLVTNTGGVLSHAAVVAREFDLPAVVGTGDATTRIVDGQMLELDGTTGYVRLL